ncbi:hypothetical protein HYFRA_00003374 [Hymenoscyphus fraxineus]|uniref:Uncharacterized protein n=1 Tax=Hymenoscyphus fraxineus TaxID=746836 RepID=A0A9N9KSP6_9HELO|nr:hypothetical protein HYFRA_00003374 [Hymenoscyphus fraxineus]
MQIAALLTTIASLATTVSAARTPMFTVYTQDNTIPWDGQGYTPCTVSVYCKMLMEMVYLLGDYNQGGPFQKQRTGYTRITAVGAPSSPGEVDQAGCIVKFPNAPSVAGTHAVL